MKLMLMFIGYFHIFARELLPEAMGAMGLQQRPTAMLVVVWQIYSRLPCLLMEIRLPSRLQKRHQAEGLHPGSSHIPCQYLHIHLHTAAPPDTCMMNLIIPLWD